MGNTESGIDKGIEQFIVSEFERVRKDNTRDYLLLSEVLQLQSQEDHPFSFAHIGNLFILDEDKDGRVTLEEILNFCFFIIKNLKNAKTYEFQSQLQAYTTLEMWQVIKNNEGENDMVAWIGRLLYENEEVSYFDNKSSVAFIKVDTVKLLYEVFNLKVMNGMNVQRFFHLLQLVGEELGLMALECEELDDYVPLVICQDFSREFLKGFSKLMKEIGFDGI